mmetsp:Transcript_13685/g.39937  ORF Transcript_13685/g.39937 Transcript_13685/m.39937 type:complete len:273 (-) Transcript_13685:2127-2945(-)
MPAWPKLALGPRRRLFQPLPLPESRRLASRPSLRHRSVTRILRRRRVLLHRRRRRHLACFARQVLAVPRLLHLLGSQREEKLVLAREEPRAGMAEAPMVVSAAEATATGAGRLRDPSHQEVPQQRRLPASPVGRRVAVLVAAAAPRRSPGPVGPPRLRNRGAGGAGRPCHPATQRRSSPRRRTGFTATPCPRSWPSARVSQTLPSPWTRTPSSSSATDPRLLEEAAATGGLHVEKMGRGAGEEGPRSTRNPNGRPTTRTTPRRWCCARRGWL